MLCRLLHAAARPDCVLADRQTLSSGCNTDDLLQCMITTVFDVRHAEEGDGTNAQTQTSKIPGCYLLHQQDATFDYSI